MDKFYIRRALPEDAPALAHIQSQSWQHAFSHILSAEELASYTDADRLQTMYQHVLLRPEAHIFIGFSDDSPCCLAAWGPSRENRASQTAELICIHCLPDRWRQGCGSRMMAHVLSDMEAHGFSTVTLWVFEGNHRARGFYEKLGFSPLGEKKTDYSAPEILYGKALQ